MIEPSVEPTGRPSLTVPHATAVKVTSRTSASPAGMESGGKKAAPNCLSLPELFALVIALALLVGTWIGASAHAAPKAAAVTWSLVRSKVTVTEPPLVATDDLAITFTVNVSPIATDCVGGSILIAARDPAAFVGSTPSRIAKIERKRSVQLLQ